MKKRKKCRRFGKVTEAEGKTYKKESDGACVGVAVYLRQGKDDWIPLDDVEKIVLPKISGELPAERAEPLIPFGGSTEAEASFLVDKFSANGDGGNKRWIVAWTGAKERQHETSISHLRRVGAAGGAGGDHLRPGVAGRKRGAP